MEKEFVEILAIYPGMYASKFLVKASSWDHYLENYMNLTDAGNCFLPCKDTEGDQLFVDMTKLLAFYVLTKEPDEKPKRTKKKTVS